MNFTTFFYYFRRCLCRRPFGDAGVDPHHPKAAKEKKKGARRNTAPAQNEEETILRLQKKHPVLARRDRRFRTAGKNERVRADR